MPSDVPWVMVGAILVGTLIGLAAFVVGSFIAAWWIERRK